LPFYFFRKQETLQQVPFSEDGYRQDTGRGLKSSPPQAFISPKDATLSFQSPHSSMQPFIYSPNPNATMPHHFNKPSTNDQ
jgi:hypothetical protein